jgi:predicted DNA-binding protein (MmcQ/YjbR family)
MTGAELRALCLSFPEATEKLTWGDADHAGDLTFRVRDKIFVITGDEHSTGASVRTSKEQQTDLIAAFPDAITSAPYVGRFGWVNVDLTKVPDEVLADIVRSAYLRTAPKKLADAYAAQNA